MSDNALAPLPAPEYGGPLAFFRRHYNGDYSLARSYWLNTLLLSIFAPALGVMLLPWLAERRWALHPRQRRHQRRKR
jgi:hypothetical protein